MSRSRPASVLNNVKLVSEYTFTYKHPDWTGQALDPQFMLDVMYVGLCARGLNANTGPQIRSLDNRCCAIISQRLGIPIHTKTVSIVDNVRAILRWLHSNLPHELMHKSLVELQKGIDGS